MPHPSGPQSTPDAGSAGSAGDHVDVREPRRTFALTGPSQPIDPRTNAVRPDIADVSLAERVFAPHYAAPLPRIVSRDVAMRAGRANDSGVVAELAAGARFDLLDVTGGLGWGISVADNLVGYLDADAIGAA